MKLSIKGNLKKKPLLHGATLPSFAGCFFNMLINDQILFCIYAKIRKMPNEWENKAIYQFRNFCLAPRDGRGGRYM